MSSKPIKHGKKWRVRPQDANGKRQSLVFDRHNDAVAASARAEVEAADIKAGRRDAPPPLKTFDDLTTYWLANRTIHKRQSKDDLSVIRCHLKPAFGGRALTTIGVAEIDAFRASKIALSPKTVSNILTLLGSMLRAALELGWIARLPPLHKPKIRLHDTDFHFLGTKEELHQFLAAAHADGADAHALYATAVFTGLRVGELAGLKWVDVDFARRVINVQRSYDGPTKSNQVRRVPIVDELLPILTAWRQVSGGELVFPNRDGNMLRECGRIFAERFHRVLDAAGFQRPKSGRAVHAFRFHDLRHTFASWWMIGGGDIFKLQRVLGHQTPEVTQRYAHLAPDAFAGDLGLFSGLSSPANAATEVQKHR